MKVGIDTNTDSYEVWQKTQKLIESLYLAQVLSHKPVRPLVVKPGGKEPGCSKSRWNIL